MNNYSNTLSNRPPSRPFQEGDISFKNQRMNPNQNYFQNNPNNYYNNMILLIFQFKKNYFFS